VEHPIVADRRTHDGEFGQHFHCQFTAPSFSVA
jgi:hypothetical protein